MKISPDDYIMRTVQILEKEFTLFCVISPKEFDILYRWWEKQIPFAVLRETFALVVTERKKKGKTDLCIQNFVYPMRKAHAQFMEMGVGQGQAQKQILPIEEREQFISHPPQEIADIVEEFKQHLGSLSVDKKSLALFYQSLLSRFIDDEELTRRTQIFLNHLAPQLRNEQIITRYRLNLLISRFSIPDLESEGEAG